MKKVILIIEDLPAEQEVAKKAAVENGFRFVIASNLEDTLRLWKNLEGKLSGIATDLHFPERENGTDAANPSGLAIITEAVTKNIPVSVCSNVNHHYAAYLKIVITNLEKLGGKRIPFTMDRKDWHLAISSLKEIIGG
jgi:CheY-like chemotaxis protein